MAELTAGQQVKQTATKVGRSWSERLKVASAKTSGANTKDIDIAIVKATTSRFHVTPKEKHVITLKYATNSRTNANYVAGSLLKRLHSATDWLTALKTLIVIHRIIRETDPAAFMEEVLRVGGAESRGRGGRVLAIDNFLDTSNIDGRFDYSEWVRAYGKYLDETLEVFSAVAWHSDLEGAGKESKLRSLSGKDLLQQMPYLQRLQRRLVDCSPRGQAARDEVVMFTLQMVVRESFKLYKGLSEGIINLADCFFSMEYLDAVKGLEIYKEALASSEALATYYSTLQNIHAFELPTLSPPPADFLETMETYVKDAPRPEVVTTAAASGEGEEEGGIAAPIVPRRTVPLRKGRFSQQHSGGFGRTVPGSEASGGMRDLGMLLPIGVAAASASPRKSDDGGNEEEEDAGAAEEVEQEEVVAVAENVEPPPIIDLLGFDDEEPAQTVITTGGAEQEQPQQQQQPSAIDLLAELDFGALSTMDSSAMNQQSAVGYNSSAPSTAAPAIPDAFVIQAAADVYGKPPPSLQSPASSSAAAAGMHSPYQQPQQQQFPGLQHAHYQQQPYYAVQQQQQQQPWNPNGSSSFAPPPLPQDDWLSSITGTPPLGGNPQYTPGSVGSGQKNTALFQQAGSHDPFSALTGLSPK